MPLDRRVVVGALPSLSAIRPPGHSDVDLEVCFRALNRIGYSGPLTIEWEHSGMNWEWRANDALAFVRRTDFAPSAVTIDAAMQRDG